MASRESAGARRQGKAPLMLAGLLDGPLAAGGASRGGGGTRLQLESLLELPATPSPPSAPSKPERKGKKSGGKQPASPDGFAICAPGDADEDEEKADTVTAALPEFKTRGKGRGVDFDNEVNSPFFGGRLVPPGLGELHKAARASSPMSVRSAASTATPMGLLSGELSFGVSGEPSFSALSWSSPSLVVATPMSGPMSPPRLPGSQDGGHSSRSLGTPSCSSTPSRNVARKPSMVEECDQESEDRDGSEREEVGEITVELGQITIERESVGKITVEQVAEGARPSAADGDAEVGTIWVQRSAPATSALQGRARPPLPLPLRRPAHPGAMPPPPGLEESATPASASATPNTTTSHGAASATVDAGQEACLRELAQQVVKCMKEECGFLRLQGHSLRFKQQSRIPMPTLCFYIHGLPGLPGARRAKWLLPLSWSVTVLLQRRGLEALVHHGRLHVRLPGHLHDVPKVRVDFSEPWPGSVTPHSLEIVKY